MPSAEVNISTLSGASPQQTARVVVPSLPMKPKGSGASADRSLLVLVSVALATSLFAHLNRWGACSHIQPRRPPAPPASPAASERRYVTRPHNARRPRLRAPRHPFSVPSAACHNSAVDGRAPPPFLHVPPDNIKMPCLHLPRHSGAPCTPSLGDSNSHGDGDGHGQGDASSGPSTHSPSSSAAGSGGCPVCDASDAAKEDTAVVALRLQLESRDGELARARRDLQDVVGPDR